MPKYEITADSHRHVKSDAQGRITSSKRYSRGDEIELSTEQAEPLLQTGGLKPAGKKDAATAVPLVGTVPVPPVPHGDPLVAPGAESGQTADEGLREPSHPSEEVLAAEAERVKGMEAAQAALQAALQYHVSGEDDADATATASDEDGYGDLSYSALQDENQKRGLPASGGKQVLIARLRENDSQ